MIARALQDSLRATCHAEGVVYREIPADGRWHEADLIDDPRGRGDGRIKLFPDGRGGLVQNWKANDKPRAFFVDDGPPLNDTERRNAIRKAEQEAKREREQAAKKAAALWKAATDLRADHPYVVRKGTVPVPTLREIGVEQAAGILGYHPKSNGEPLAGRLLIVPVKIDGKLSTLEMIDEQGRKSAIAGGAKAGGFWAAQALPEGDGTGLALAIGEGVSTVLSVHQGTGYPVIAALSASNLANLAKAMRDRYPAARLLILGDLGNGQAKAEEAAKASGAALAIPKFTPEQIQAFQHQHGKAPTDFNDLHQTAGPEAVRAQIAAALSEPTTPTEKTYSLLTFDDLAALPPMKWRVKGVLPESGVTAIYGPSGSGKSFLALDLAGAIGAGREWFGHRVNMAPVVYVCLEGQSGLRNRVAAYRTQHGGDSLANVRFVIESFHILNGDAAALIRTIQAAGLEKPVIVIDTLNRAAPGADENSGVDMGRIIEAAHIIQQATGGLVTLVHHSGKDSGRGMRGHSSLHAALDAVIEVKRDGENREWSLTKAKDGTDGIKYTFALRVHQFGEDGDGDPVTSCSVVLEVGGEDDQEEARKGQTAKPKPVKGPQGANQKIVFSAIKDALKSTGTMSVDEAVEAVKGRLTCEEKRKTERARSAMATLIAEGFLVCQDGMVSLPQADTNPVPVFPFPFSHSPKGGNGKNGNPEIPKIPENGKNGNGDLNLAESHTARFREVGEVASLPNCPTEQFSDVSDNTIPQPCEYCRHWSGYQCGEGRAVSDPEVTTCGGFMARL